MNYFLSHTDGGSSFLQENNIERIYLLEGKSACIKSRLIKSVSLFAEKNGYAADVCLSKHDYDKLCAVKIIRNGVLIADSNYFNKTNANYTKTIINTDKFFKNDISRDQEYIKLNKYITDNLSDSAKSENAARSLLLENKRLVVPYISKSKILNYIFRFISRNGLQEKEEKGKNEKRFITQTTPWGIHTCYETIMQSAKIVAVIRDEYKYVSSTLISGLAAAFNQCGKDTVSLYCSIDSECAEHLIVPELSAAFFTENRNHPYPFSDTGELSVRRFLKCDPPAEKKTAIRRNNELIDDFLDESVFSLFEVMEAENRICDMLADSFAEEKFNNEKDNIISDIFKN